MDEKRFSSAEVDEILKILVDADVKAIDTSEGYMDSEKVLGEAGAASRITIDTKYSGGFNPRGEPTKDFVISCAEESLKKLKTDSVSLCVNTILPHRQARPEYPSELPF